MSKIFHISVWDNRKSEFTEKPKAFAFFKYFHFKFSESIYNCSRTLFICPDFWVRSNSFTFVFAFRLILSNRLLQNMKLRQKLGQKWAWLPAGRLVGGWGQQPPQILNPQKIRVNTPPPPILNEIHYVSFNFHTEFPNQNYWEASSS